MHDKGVKKKHTLDFISQSIFEVPLGDLKVRIERKRNSSSRYVSPEAKEQRSQMYLYHKSMPKEVDESFVVEKISAFVKTLSKDQPFRAFYNQFGIAIEVLSKDTTKIWYSGNLENEFQEIKIDIHLPQKSGLFVSSTKDFALKIKDVNSSLLNDSPCTVIDLTKT